MAPCHSCLSFFPSTPESDQCVYQRDRFIFIRGEDFSQGIVFTLASIDLRKGSEGKKTFSGVLSRSLEPEDLANIESTLWTRATIFIKYLKRKSLLGCALEIGWVNKEPGIVSFTWLILQTSLFALSQSLSHAPTLILYFSHATYTTPLPPFAPCLNCALSYFTCSLCPLSCPFQSLSRRCTLISSAPPFFFFLSRDHSRTAIVRSVCLLQTEGLFPLSVFSQPPSVLFCRAAVRAREFFALVRVIAPSVMWNPALIAPLLSLNQRHCSPATALSINRHAHTQKCLQIQGSGGKNLPLCVGGVWEMYHAEKFERFLCDFFLFLMSWSNRLNALQLKCHPVTERSALTFSHDPLLLSCYI